MAESSDAITGKFDFYDVLGYLVPGLLFAGLLWLPIGLFYGVWPSTSITSAAFYLVGAHIVGHILQGFVRGWEKVPLVRDRSGQLRAPSSIALDAGADFVPAVRDKIAKLANDYWEISAADLLAENHDHYRVDAFLQARNLLLQTKKQSYFEQFQGKYALLVGTAAALLLASAYYAGWAIPVVAPWSSYFLYIFGTLLLLLVLYIVFENRIGLGRRALVSLLCIGAVLGGVAVANLSYQSPEKHRQACPTCAVCCNGSNSEDAGQNDASPSLRIDHKAILMLILSLAALGGAARCYGGYKEFANEFAKGVWRDFANFDVVATDSGKK